MGFKCGIVGLPNVGKSTVFNAMTNSNVAASNYPFCTIEPSVGVVAVPDPRLNILADIIKPKKVVPAVMQFVDIAGLVKGAASGEGLGNQFLANIRETDAIVHVVRCFENNNIVHVAGKVDPIHDIEIIQTELALADLESVERALLKNQKLAKSGQKTAVQEGKILEKFQDLLSQGISIRTQKLNAEEEMLAKRFGLLTGKPVLYIANVADENFTDNKLLKLVQEYAAKENAQVVPLCAETEAYLVNLSVEERQEFMADLGLTEPGLNNVVRAGFSLLNLQTYFTAGVQEVRAWTISCGANAKESAGVIHTDFATGFIRAEVIAYDAFVQYKGEQGAKDAGKMRLEGKEYIVKDGDIMHFLFNV